MDVNSEPARVEATAHGPTAVSGIIMHAHAAMDPHRLARTPPVRTGDTPRGRVGRCHLLA